MPSGPAGSGRIWAQGKSLCEEVRRISNDNDYDRVGPLQHGPDKNLIKSKVLTDRVPCYDCSLSELRAILQIVQLVYDTKIRSLRPPAITSRTSGLWRVRSCWNEAPTELPSSGHVKPVTSGSARGGRGRHACYLRKFRIVRSARRVRFYRIFLRDERKLPI